MLVSDSPFGHNLRKIDQIDRSIIAALRADPQTSNKQISQDLGISEATVATRIDGLIEDKLIKLTVQRDISTVGYTLVGIVEVFAGKTPVLPLAHAIGEIEDVLSVTVFVDEPQILAFVAARSLEDFLELTAGPIGRLPGVGRISTAVSLEMCLLKPGIAAL